VTKLELAVLDHMRYKAVKPFMFLCGLS